MPDLDMDDVIAGAKRQINTGGRLAARSGINSKLGPVVILSRGKRSLYVTPEEVPTVADALTALMDHRTERF